MSVVIVRNNEPNRVSLRQVPGVGPPGTIENFSISGAAPFSLFGSIQGSLYVAAGIHRFYPNRAGRIGSVSVSMGTAPTGADAVFDVNLNGASIFSNLNRPRVLDGQNFSLNNVPDVVDFVLGDYFTFDVDQRGAINWGGAATLTIWYF